MTHHDIRSLLATLLTSGEHRLRPGGDADHLDAVGRDLGQRLPKAYRDLLGRSDGLDLCDGLVTLWSTEVLVEKNRALHSPGGWFDHNDIFIAESAIEERFALSQRERPDFFYIDANEGDDPPVRMFHLTPTKLGIVAPNLHAWIDLVVRNRGFGAPCDLDGA